VPSQIVPLNNRGFTLIEVVVAILIMMVGLLGLLAAIDLAMDMNTRDYMRDEAVRVGERAMNATKGTAYNSIATGSPTTQTISTNIRGIAKNYNVATTVEKLQNSKHISIVVNWTYKGQQYYHGVDSVVAP
jgi:type IV pilus assembly protein PilV